LGKVLLVVCGGAALSCASASPSARTVQLPPEVRADDPLAPTILMQQGEALVREGRIEEGRARLQAALQLQPTNPTIHNQLGLAEMAAGRPAQAIDHFTRALQLAPTFSDARNNRGAAYMQLGQYSQAEADFLQALGDRYYPNRAGVYFNLGSLHVLKGSLVAAEENLRRAAVPTGPIEAFLLLGEVEERLGKLELAESALRDGISRAPERTDLLLALAAFLERRGRAREARAYYEKVVALAPYSQEAEQARLRLKAGS
jgi:Flp pilus assembly protein TadD